MIQKRCRACKSLSLARARFGCRSFHQRPEKRVLIDAATATKLMKEWTGSTAILFDTKGAVGQLYGAKTTPHMFVIDKAGLLAYQGAIDDQPSATRKSLEGAHNYVADALTALEKGEPVKTASTTPYGCSVKY